MSHVPATPVAAKPAAAKPPKAAKAKSVAGKTWKTKYGPRRVRQEGPTLEEAIFAARGLSDNEQAQIEIAASLMQLPLEDVRQAMAKIRTPRREAATFAFAGRAGSERSVVVERKPSRRPLTRAAS